MKLLFDQNLSFKLVGKLATLYPGSSHVKLEGLDKKDDLSIWDFASKNGFTVITQDADFSEIGILKGFPPKIIWLRCGNTSTANIESILTTNFSLIKDFILNLPQGCLELY